MCVKVCKCVYLCVCMCVLMRVDELISLSLLALQCGTLLSLAAQVEVALLRFLDCRRSALLLSASHLLGMFRATLALYSFAFAFAFAPACLLAYLLLITFVAR